MPAGIVRKGVFMKRIFIVVSVFVLMVAGCATGWKKYTLKGEEIPFLGGAKGVMTIGYYGSENTKLEFLVGGQMKYIGKCTWDRNGRKVRFIVNNGHALCEGTYNPKDNTIKGIAQNKIGEGWNFTIELDPSTLSNPPSVVDER
jgi:hypothetical protein